MRGRRRRRSERGWGGKGEGGEGVDRLEIRLPCPGLRSKNNNKGTSSRKNNLTYLCKTIFPGEGGGGETKYIA